MSIWSICLQKNALEALYCRSISEECGKTEPAIRSELGLLNCMDPPAEISLETYYKYSAYSLDVFNDRTAAAHWMDKLSRYFSLRDFVIYKNEVEGMPFPAFEKDLEEARSLLSEILSGGRKNELIGAIKDIRPDLLTNTAEADKVAVDMELSISILGFVPEEYVSYHFWEKSVPERLEYVSDRLRRKIGQLLNSQEGMDILNNKYLTYQALEPLYGRRIRQMDSDSGYPAFEKAFRENSVLFKKNNFQSLGKEIEKIEASEDTDLRALYERIAANGRYFILEDMIIQHPDLSRLNPDSVNTIRLVTFLDRNGPVVLDCILRVGRKGSFVDNAGSGGIFIHIDPSNGVTDSRGIDERGLVYESHPDHSYRFRGIRLPFWEDALNTAKEAANMIPGARFVGWDIACTNDDRWIIVEGNSRPMYIVHQATTDTGKRKELLDSIYYREEQAPV